MKREIALLKNTIIIAFGTILPKLASLIILPIITAELTKGEYGTYDLITTLSALILPVVTLQIQTASFRFLIEYELDKEKQRTVITNIIFFVIVTSIVALVIVYFVLGYFDFSLRILILLYFSADISLNVFQQIARGLHQNKQFSISAATVSFVNMILIILIVGIINARLEGALIAIWIATFSASSILFVRLKIWSYISLNKFSLNCLKELLGYSWPMVPNTLSNWVMNLSDRLVITAVIGVEANAVYSVANKIPNLFTSVQGTFVMAWQENASTSAKDKDIAQYYTKMFYNIFNMYFALMACIISATPILFRLLIKGDYVEAYDQILILFMGILFSGIASFLGGIYVAEKRTKSIGVTTIVAAMLNFVINILLIRVIGLYAASISTLLSYFVLALYRMKDIQKFVNIRYNYSRIVIICIILFFMCFLCSKQKFYMDIINVFLAVSMSIFFNKNIIRTILRDYVKKDLEK